MRQFILIIIGFNLFATCYAQKPVQVRPTDPVADSLSYTITNTEAIITNDMIFFNPADIKKNKQPLVLVNGKQVPTIAYYNREELKSITVLQPKEGSLKFGNKGRNGVIIVKLKDEVKTPEIKILTNKVYYKCEIEGQIVDTSKTYFEKVNGKNCYLLDLNDSSKVQTLYSNFNNEIKIKNLGVGWDMAEIHTNGATLLSQGEGNYRVFIKKEEPIKIVITTCMMTGSCITKEIICRVLALPLIKH